MKKWTVLKIYFILYLACCLIYTILNWNFFWNELVTWNTTPFYEGWEVISLAALVLLGLIGLLIDYILTKFIKNRRTLNNVEIVLAIAFSIALWFGSK